MKMKKPKPPKPTPPTPHIACAMIVKNEQKRLKVTLSSVVGHVDSFVIYDTGSTDDTCSIVENFCRVKKTPLHLKRGTFVDFSTTRNEMLDFAASFPEIDFLLLMDCNDELRGGPFLRTFAEDFQTKDENVFSTGALLCQQWWSGAMDKYYNIRFIKNHRAWRYCGVVHEYIQDPGEKPGLQTLKVDEHNVVIFQDRTQDDDKSSKRFSRDHELLLKEHKKDPEEPRTIFYLAQTCCCLHNFSDAYYYYTLRASCPNQGFWEEVFHSYLRAGEMAQRHLRHSWEHCMGLYMKAYERDRRAEPLVRIGEYYKEKKMWDISFQFLSLACQLEYPSHNILFVDKLLYDYTRWHHLGIVAYYVQQYELGKVACLKAIAAGRNVELDTSNLKFYESNLNEQPNVAKECQKSVKSASKSVVA